MPDYRAYLLDQDGHIKLRVDLACEDEATAKERAKQLVQGHAVERWQGDRRIKTFAVAH